MGRDVSEWELELTMTLGVGTSLGTYEITGELGAGGMGEVYRATDTNLKRDVAIKILPSALSEDADRLARFQREAEVLASLNHPNIAQIYGLERSDGTTAFVMELVEGSTLADRIAEGPIPTADALDIAVQIADALEAAHGQGIVHRDLKPANIKLKPDGTVKVLDFGIAKALETRRGTSGAQTPSLTTPAVTQAGILLGTAAYMSPEQARGKAVDQRADIWAFGCLLYEMLTGQPVFVGDDVSATLARVLEREVDVSSLPVGITPGVRQTIGLCLEKDPRKRLADIRDVKLALEGAFEAEPHGTADPETLSRPLWSRAVPISVAVILTALLAVGLTWDLTRPASPAPEPVSRFVVTPTAPLASLAGADIAISPDGKRLAYVAQDPQRGGVEVYLRDLDGLHARAVPGTKVAQPSAGMSPFFSPDAQWIAFRSPGQGIMRVSLNGEPPLKIVDDSSPTVFTGTWTTDGTLIYSSGGKSGTDGLYRVSASGGGTPKQLMSAPQDTGLLRPELLPGGRAVLFALDNGSHHRIGLVNLETGKQRVLVDDGIRPSYVGTGDIVFVRGTTLMAVPFDLDRLAVTGQPVPLLQGIRDYALSDTGTLVYVPGASRRAKSAVVWVNRDGRVVGPALSDLVENPRDPRLSPDGQRLVLTTGPPTNGDLWVEDLSGRPPIPLATTKGEDILPTWSPDGMRIAFLSNRSGTYHVYLAPADGSVADPKPLRREALQAEPAAWSAKGELILVTGGWDIVATSVDGEGNVRDVVSTPYQEYDAALSPSGRWLAYTSNRTGRPEIWVKGYPKGVAVRVSANGGREPVWSHDGKELFYLQGNAMMAVPVKLGIKAAVTFPFNPAKKLFTGPYFVSQNPTIRSYDVARDGRFLMIEPAANSAQPAHIVVVQNWFEELKRRMSTK